jgi:spermidine/putrescine-binding protein
MNRKFYTKFILNIFISLIISLFIIFILYLPNILVYEFNNSINVFAWPSTFDKDMISKFENENNIKVNISYYSTNEELISKLQATNSNGYDIVIPSDYAVNILKNGNLLQKIDKSKLNFYNKLNPALLGHYFDIHNDYSIPFEWAIFGIGIDKNFFTVDGKYYKPSSLDVLFNNIYNFSGIEKNYKVIMSDDPYVSIAIALLYIFKNLDQISVEHIQKVKELLKYQYSFIEAYSENKADYYLVTGNCPVALASSSYI